MEWMLFYGILVLEFIASCMIGFGTVIVRRCGVLLLVVCMVLYGVFVFYGTDEVYTGAGIFGCICTLYVLLLYAILP